MSRFKKPLTYFVIVCMAFACAMSYQLFVFPNKFAPSGLNGLCSMFQHITGLSMGYLSLLLNIPLAIAVYCKVSKTLAIRAMTYVGCFSLFLMLLEHIDLSAFAYATDNGTSTILGPLVAGILNGACFNVLLKASAYSGGTDFVASLIHKKRPDFSFFWVGFSINVVVAALSYFVYGYQIEPVLLCVLYSFASSSVTEKLTKSGRSAIRFEIITDHPQELAEIIVTQLHHTATLVPGRGIYRGKETNLLICVVNKTQSAQLSAIIRQMPGTFAVMSQVSEVMGNFKHFDSHGNHERELLDVGEGTGI